MTELLYEAQLSVHAAEANFEAWWNEIAQERLALAGV